MTERYCRHCRKLLVRREGERPSKFAERSCCDLHCANKARKPDHSGHRSCPVCKAVLRPRERESPSAFSGRRFCSPECASRAQVKEPPPEVVEEIIRLFEQDKKSAHAISNLIGISRERVIGVLQRRGIEVKLHVSARKEEPEQEPARKDRYDGIGINPIDPVPAKLLAAMPSMPLSELLTVCRWNKMAEWHARRMGLLKDGDGIAA